MNLFSSKSSNYPNTAQNFFKNTITEADDPEPKLAADKNNDKDEIDNEDQDNSEVEIGCKE